MYYIKFLGCRVDENHIKSFFEQKSLEDLVKNNTEKDLKMDTKRKRYRKIKRL